MRNLLLSAVLLAVPVGVFAVGHQLPPGAGPTPVAAKVAGPSLGDMTPFAVSAFRDKGTERCNADDDARADALFARDIALLSK